MDLRFYHDGMGMDSHPEEIEGLNITYEDYEKGFGTPHGVDLAALCAATHTPHVLVDTLAGLDEALRPAPGLRVVQVRTDRTEAVAVHGRLREAVAAALTPA